MKGSSITTWLILAVTLLFDGSCAKQAAPTGGPDDVAPPKIVKSTPLNGTVNYREKTIVVTFDEYVVFDKLTEKFMISPPTDEKPKITLKGKSLNIVLPKKLKDSTTYTLYFQDAIKDLNAGNVFNNFQFVFSTGSVIDSLSVTGNVLLANNLEPDKSILVMMYSQQADSAPRKMLPDYITLADVNGYFRLNNIRNGNYRIYALKDNNNNKKFDLADEEFAFGDSVISVKPETNWLPEKPDTTTVKPKGKAQAIAPVKEGINKLFLFTGEKKTFYLPSSPVRKNAYQLIYILSKPPDSLKFDVEIPGSDPKNYFFERSLKKDTLTVWLRDSSLFSRQEINTIVTYPFTDSTGNVVYKQDSSKLRFIAVKPSKTKVPVNLYKLITNLSYSSLRPGEVPYFLSKTPFRDPDTSKVRLYETDKNVRKAIPYVFVRDSGSYRKIIIRARLKEGLKYLFVADKGAFGSIYGEETDSAGINFEVRPANAYGHLKMNIQKGEGDMLIQFLSSQEVVLAERKIKDKGIADFPMLEKGKYKFRVIYDLNGDGKWNTGDFDKHLQPEPVSYYPEEIEVKIDWEENYDWDVSRRNFKKQVAKDPKETGR
jgi:uncharacterized protein (DUF2141 family)